MKAIAFKMELPSQSDREGDASWVPGKWWIIGQALKARKDDSSRAFHDEESIFMKEIWWSDYPGWQSLYPDKRPFCLMRSWTVLQRCIIEGKSKAAILRQWLDRDYFLEVL